MIKSRHYWLALIERSWEKKSVLWLSGVRRAGKTFLCKSLPDVQYFDCELPRTRRLIEDPEQFLEDGQGKRLVLDEVHRLPKEAARLVNEDEIRAAALANAEGNGIVFIDEIDKVASRQDHGGAEVSRQGVQRDLLPLVEGTTVSTKYGVVKTDHMLFIASGAFHLAKPSDLIPELQGRFPIRVELGSLSVADFEKILVATDACLTRQYEALLATDDVRLEFTADGVRRLAEIACSVNERTENIGARGLRRPARPVRPSRNLHTSAGSN